MARSDVDYFLHFLFYPIIVSKNKCLGLRPRITLNTESLPASNYFQVGKENECQIATHALRMESKRR